MQKTTNILYGFVAGVAIVNTLGYAMSGDTVTALGWFNASLGWLAAIYVRIKYVPVE
jgi:hypothetical protein